MESGNVSEIMQGVVASVRGRGRERDIYGEREREREREREKKKKNNEIQGYCLANLLDSNQQPLLPKT